MNSDFHYYGTYAAARLAGYERSEAKTIAYYAQFVDECSKDFLTNYGLADETPTVQSDAELRALFTDLHKYTAEELKEAAQTWGAFHFLPGNIDNEIAPEGMSDQQQLVFKRLCMPNSILLHQTVRNAQANGTLPAIGMAMHILADTWAHCYFAGIPVKFINDATGDVYEVDGGSNTKLVFTWDTFADNLSQNHYSCTPPNPLRDQSITYLGHGRMGHLPDYGFMRYRYVPAWNNGAEVIKDNPGYFMNAFCQMITAMRYIRGAAEEFRLDDYADSGQDTRDRIQSVICTRKADTSEEWKDFILHYLSFEDEAGGGIEEFRKETCAEEYLAAGNKSTTSLYKFLKAAKDHEEFVTNVVGEYTGM